MAKISTDATSQCRDSPWVATSQQPCRNHEDLTALTAKLMGSGGGFSAIEDIHNDSVYLHCKAELNQYIYTFSKEQEWRKTEMMKDFFSEYLRKRKQNLGQVRELLSIIDSDIANLKNITMESGHTELDSIANEAQSSLSHFAELKVRELLRL